MIGRSSAWLRSASVMAFASVGAFSAAAAQTASPPGAAEQNSVDSDSGIADIVVTAQRRAEVAQDVPIAVAAFNQAQMDRVGLASTADLPSLIPGLTVSAGAGGARSPFSLRGVGNSGYSTSPSVLTFIDGVYQPFDSKGLDFSNVQSVEVVKGPQGTLFGRNATGGVIQIATRNPLDWQGVDAQIGYANYDTLTGKLYGAAKLSDAAAIDLSGFYYNRADGWGTNVTDGSDAYRHKRLGVRSKLVAELGETFKATLSGDYSYRRGQEGLAISIPAPDGFLFNPVTQAAFTLPTPYDISSEFTPTYRSREGGAALTLEKKLGDTTIQSISSYRKATEHLDVDFDGTSFEAIHLRRRDGRKSFSQELQASGGDDRFNWVTGLYYLYMKSDINGPRFSGLFFPAGFQIASVDETNAYAVYAQGTAEILAETRLTLGARYTIEKRQITGRTSSGGIVIPGSEGTEKATFKKPNFRVALDHKFTPNILAYASWSRGFNAGFFNQISFGGFTEAANPLVKPEEIDAYEAGLKTDFFNRKLVVNVAAFLYDYSNLQQQVFSPGGIISINAASARIKGVDLDITARPVRGLSLSLSANYLDTKYLSYPQAPNYDILANGAFVAVGPRDARGKQIVGAPKLGVQLTGTYTLITGVGNFDSTFTMNYQAKQYSDPQNEFPLRKRTLLGFTERWTSNDERTFVSLWVKNLTNRKYDVSYSLLEPVGAFGNPGEPRTYGITIGRKFD